MITHPEPVELTSEGLSVGGFDPEVEESLVSEELCSFVIQGKTAGTSQIAKVRFYSLDVNKPGTAGLDYAETATISIGIVPGAMVADLVKNAFEKVELKTKYCTVQFFNGYINRISISEEGGGKASLVLDVSSPRIAE